MRGPFIFFLFSLSGQKILVATGTSSKFFNEFGRYIEDVQLLDLSITTKTCAMKKYPFAMTWATGALINNFPLICGGIKTMIEDAP